MFIQNHLCDDLLFFLNWKFGVTFSVGWLFSDAIFEIHLSCDPQAMDFRNAWVGLCYNPKFVSLVAMLWTSCDVTKSWKRQNKPGLSCANFVSALFNALLVCVTCYCCVPHLLHLLHILLMSELLVIFICSLFEMSNGTIC